MFNQILFVTPHIKKNFGNTYLSLVLKENLSVLIPYKFVSFSDLKKFEKHAKKVRIILLVNFSIPSLYVIFWMLFCENIRISQCKLSTNFRIQLNFYLVPWFLFTIIQNKLNADHNFF
jgi:hypothetical protein